MGIRNLDRVFEPRTIAVIGVNGREDNMGGAVIRNLLNSGFVGTILPITTERKTVFGLDTCPALEQVSDPIDLVVLATPLATAPEIIAACAAKDVGGVMIIAAGGREAGPESKVLEQRIILEANRARLRVIGPNCLGVIRPKIGLNVSFAPQITQPGKLAFISQSGAICTAILDLSLKEGVGLSHFVSVGSMLDVDFGDLIDFLGNDPEVKSILLYIESLTEHRKFMSAARAVSRVKPIIALKAGRSAAGARAATSHTGAMTGQDAVYDAAFERAGIVRVRTIGELFDTAELLAKQPRPSGQALAIITNAGGPGVMAADALADFGTGPTPLSERARVELDQFLPPYWSRNNPIDLLGDASPEHYAKAIDACGRSNEFDGILAILAPQAVTDPSAVAESVIQHFKNRRFPVISAWMGASTVAEGVERLNRAGIPTYSTPEQAVRAFMHMVEYSNKLKILQEIPIHRPIEPTFCRSKAAELIHGALERNNGAMGEMEAKAVLAAYGLPMLSPTQACDEQDAEHLDCELLLGAARDPQFGPVIVFGYGGTLTEIIRDRALALPPLNHLLARRLIEQTRIAQALRGYRNRSCARMDLLEDMIVRLSQLLVDFPEISELDMNPILVKNGLPHVVNAHIVLDKPPRSAPFHLVISPYPEQQELYTTSKSGMPIFVRPIRPEDASLFTELFESLSPTSIYYRFFSPVKSLSEAMLARFTQVDYDREIALVALEDKGAEGKMLAVTRVIAEPDGHRAEFAVLVGDPWQGQGIGAKLLEQCLRMARKRGIRWIWGTVLRENTQMLALAKKLRFRIKRVPGSDDCELEMDLSQIDFDK